MKKKLCELIQANRQIFDIDVSETDKDEYVKSKVSKAIFYSLDFETAVNSGTAKIGHEKDGFPYFIEWNEPLTFRQMYYIVNLICGFGKKEQLPPSLSHIVLCYISQEYSNRTPY